MESIEPGEQFTIGYGDGKTLQVVSLSLRDQIRLSEMLADMIEADNSTDTIERLRNFRSGEAILKLCSPNHAETALDEVSATSVVEIGLKTLNNQKLTEDEEKK